MLFTANKMSKFGEQFNRFYRVEWCVLESGISIIFGNICCILYLVYCYVITRLMLIAEINGFILKIHIRNFRIWQTKRA